MNIKFFGDFVFFIFFGEVIDDEVNVRVYVVVRVIEGKDFGWLVEVVFVYFFLVVIFDLLKVIFEDVKKVVELLFDVSIGVFKGWKIEIFVFYGGEYGFDIEFVVEYNGLGVDDVIEIYFGKIYCVYFFGFLLGFVYLSFVDERIVILRLERLCLKVFVGLVGIVGR